MRRIKTSLALALALSSGVAFSTGAAARSEVAPTPATQKAEKSGLVPTIKPTVDIVFAIDTTGSMGGLIDGAKRKVWAIANEVASAKEQPNVRIGLVAFRDRGDEYVTKTFDLSDNLDAVYEQLMRFQAGGGGDGPEDVNSALNDAVNKMTWTKDKKALKMIFLVGDAPPHMDYEQQVQWQATAKQAIRQNIYINTVQCGIDSETTAVWKNIAHAAEGRYASIPQDGGVRVATTTPFDGELSRLASELDATNFTYGRRDVRESKTASRKKAGEYASAAPAAASADRAVAKMSLGSGMKSSEDIVSLADDVGGAEEALKKVSADELPDELRGKSKKDQAAIIAENQAKRAVIEKKIAELSTKRAQHLKEESKKAEAPPADAFDSEVAAIVRSEGAKVGLTY
jgi:Mg-chelatase subunit ChlD